MITQGRAARNKKPGFIEKPGLFKNLFKISLLADFCDDFSPNAKLRTLRIRRIYANSADKAWRKIS
jgi:hypothetical protein